MKEILKIIYIAVCLYPVYRWVKDAVDDIRCSSVSYTHLTLPTKA